MRPSHKESSSKYKEAMGDSRGRREGFGGSGSSMMTSLGDIGG